MCGLAGYLNLNGEPASLPLLKSMTDAIAHRGPDGEGHLTDGPLGFGHRRLSIIDLSDASSQPMTSRNGRYVLIYNGEIYNYQSLRSELASRGVKFHTQGDTEVVLEAINEWGLHEALSHFNGMFAFALWDKWEKRLKLARDRYGIKPLYYTLQGNRFIFGSEIKALLASGFVRAQMNAESLVEYLTFQNFFGQSTLFKDVKILPAGSWLDIGLNESDCHIRQYWDFDFQEPLQVRKEEDYLEELDYLFRQAVTRNLVADVDVAAYLSGGLDSGSITAIAASILPEMKTFTIGFDLNSASGVEMAFDERKSAEFMSGTFKTEHYEMVLKAGDMERALPRMTRHIEEPRVGQSYPNFYAAQLAGKFVKVVLSGAGGDEIFGGYPWRYYRAAGSANFDDYVDRYYDFWQRLLKDKQLQQVLDPVWNDIKHISPKDIFRKVFAGHEGPVKAPEDYVNKSLYFEAKTFLHGLLVIEDKLSMAHSLETRVPFLDNDLVDFAMRLPAKMKIGNLTEVVRADENLPGKSRQYFNKTNDGKLLLRKLMRRYIPENVANAAKQGFSAPDASWFKGESINYVRRAIYDGSPAIYDYLDKKAALTLVDEHMDGKENRRLLIWSLLSLENWCKEFLGATA